MLKEVMSGEKDYMRYIIKKRYAQHVALFAIMGGLIGWCLYGIYPWHIITPWIEALIGIAIGCLFYLFMLVRSGRNFYQYYKRMGDIWQLTFTNEKYQEEIEGSLNELIWHKEITLDKDGAFYVLGKRNQPELLIDGRKLSEEEKTILEQVMQGKAGYILANQNGDWLIKDDPNYETIYLDRWAYIKRACNMHSSLIVTCLIIIVVVNPLGMMIVVVSILIILVRLNISYNKMKNGVRFQVAVKKEMGITLVDEAGTRQIPWEEITHFKENEKEFLIYWKAYYSLLLPKQFLRAETISIIQNCGRQGGKKNEG